MGFTAILAYAEGLPVRHHPHSRFMIRISLITITICSALLSDNRIGYALPDSPTADVIKELTSWAGQSESARPRLADQEFAKTPLNKAQANRLRPSWSKTSGINWQASEKRNGQKKSFGWTNWK